ncbi:MAG: tetratricopeptide repeat protein [Candidatus Kuenenia sp.]|nr:tetratricopeptide repeat protein [Candidatus Kuenenia hertensis]
MKFISFKLPKYLDKFKKTSSSEEKPSFIKTNKQFSLIIGIIFVVCTVLLFCYWFLKEKPYYEKLLSQKDEQIKTLKFLRMKQQKIDENTYETKIAEYEEKLKNEYVPKSLYDEKIKEYTEKLTSYTDDYFSKKEHEEKLKALEEKYREDHLSKIDSIKKENEKKVTRLEQKISLLKDKNFELTSISDKSISFIEKEKDELENALPIERKKALIPSLILPETQNKTLGPSTLKKLVAIKEKLENIEKMNIGLNPDTYLELGLISYYNGQYDKAIEQWENAVSLNKNNLNAYLCLGIVYNQENMSENAIVILKRAITINPKYATLHLALARIYEEKEMLDNAIYEYSKVLEIEPDTTEILNILGNLYEKKGMKEEAKKAFDQYKKLKNDTAK